MPGPNKPLIDHLIERLNFSKNIDKIILAIPKSDKNNFINTTEIILNISDNINGKYEFSSWGYDGARCLFSNGEIKNENTVRFSLECSSEGDTYDAGSYTIEIIDESTLRWKSDDGRYDKVYNYTFIPIE